MTVKDSGYYFPGEFKATETLQKEIFSGLFSSLNIERLVFLLYKAKNKKSKRKLQILTQYNRLTPLEKSNMANPTTGLYKRSVRPFQPSFKNIVKHLYSIQTKNDQSTAITYTINKACPVSIGAVYGYQRSGTVRDRPVVFPLGMLFCCIFSLSLQVNSTAKTLTNGVFYFLSDIFDSPTVKDWIQR